MGALVAGVDEEDAGGDLAGGFEGHGALGGGGRCEAQYSGRAGFVATGELRASYGKSAAFDAWHVRGPNVNLARSEDGSWDGTGFGAIYVEGLVGPRHLAVGLEVAYLNPTSMVGLRLAFPL